MGAKECGVACGAMSNCSPGQCETCPHMETRKSRLQELVVEALTFRSKRIIHVLVLYSNALLPSIHSSITISIMVNFRSRRASRVDLYHAFSGSEFTKRVNLLLMRPDPSLLARLALQPNATVFISLP